VEETADVCLRVVTSLEPVRAEIDVGGAFGGKDVPDDHDQGVSHGEERLALGLGAKAAAEAAELSADVGVTGAHAGPGGFAQRAS